MTNSYAKAKGRRDKATFIMVRHDIYRSAAWRTLHAGARNIWLEIAYRYNGRNNGEISLSVREASMAALCGKSTAHKHLKQLQEHGFIHIAEKGTYSNRIATTWILTHENHYDRTPTNEWRKWAEQNEARESPA